MSIEHVNTLIIGAGQAGIAASEHLASRGIPHLVLEKKRIAVSWRTARWDSLVANGPAWHDRFPNMDFTGCGPDAFVPKEQVADYFVAYAEKIGAPVRCGVEVKSVHKEADGSFRVETSEGLIKAAKELGFEKPLYVQYLIYVSNLVTGDLGSSIRYKLPVSTLIAQFLPATLFLVGYVMAITIPLTLLLSVAAARSRDGVIDVALRFLAILGMTFPVFWLALMMSRFFGVELGWFPVSGYGRTFGEHLHHLFLPAVSTSAWLVPLLFRSLRGAVVEQMDADYVAASRSRGLPEATIFSRHILPNSILPTLNLLGIMVTFLMGSSIVVELVYAVPGLGTLMVNAVIGRDYQVIQGLTLVYALATVIVTTVVDILSTMIDPRIEA